MATLKKTRLGTSDIVGDICTNGIALFPKIGGLRAGVSTGLKPVKLIDVHPDVWVASLHFTITNTVKTGICGPGYGLRFDLEGEADSQRGTFKVSNDSAAAGFFVGHAVDPRLRVDLNAFGRNWVKVNIGQEIDLIAVLIEVIKTLLRKNTKDGKVEKGETKEKGGVKIGLWGMYDQGFGDLGTKGQMVVRPSYDFPYDIAGSLVWLRPMLDSLRKVGASFSFGPGLSVMVPVTLKVADVQYNGTRYDSLKFEGGQYHGTAKPPEQRSNSVSTRLSHAPGFDLGLFLFVSLKLGKWINAGNKTPKLPLLQLMNIAQFVTAGPYYNCLDNEEGGTSVGGVAACAAPTADLEVILEPESKVA